MTLNFISFLEKHLLSCPWKKLGMDCLGCGIQRSLILLLQGEFVEAFYMYPPIYSIFIMFLYLGLHLKFRFKFGHKILLGLFIINILVTFANYIIKHNLI